MDRETNIVMIMEVLKLLYISHIVLFSPYATFISLSLPFSLSPDFFPCCVVVMPDSDVTVFDVSKS
jgi:hypothetical protein